MIYCIARCFWKKNSATSVFDNVESSVGMVVERKQQTMDLLYDFKFTIKWRFHGVDTWNLFRSA